MHVLKFEKIALLTPILCFILYTLFLHDLTPKVVAHLDGPKLTLPYKNNNAQQLTTYKIKVFTTMPENGLFRVVPDDCIETFTVNENNINVHSIPNRCDWGNGTQVDLSPYLVFGENSVSVTISNKGGPGGIDFYPIESVKNVITILKFILLFLSFALPIVIILRRFGFDRVEIAIILSAIFVHLSYLGYTDYNTRTFDVMIHTGHLDYIKYILANFSLPNPSTGWEYHQPPLYYIFGAIVFWVAELIGINPPVALQFFSLVMFEIFLVFSAQILKNLISNNKLLYFSLLIVFFLPSGIIHSIRIGNDTPFYMFFTISLYFVVLWWRGKREQKNFYKSLFFGVLSFVSKSGGIVIFGIIGMLLIVLAIEDKSIKKYLKQAVATTLFFLVAFLISFADNIYYAMQDNKNDWLVSNVTNTINSKLYVNNEVQNYIVFDTKTFFENPYIDTWNDKYGRQYFWNFFIKTSLFSEFFFDTKFQKAVAVLLSPFVLALFFISFVMTLLLKKEQIYEYLPILLSMFFLMLVLLAYRIKIPVSCNTDFRYIFPIIISMAFLYTLMCEKIKEKNMPILKITFYGIPMVIAFMSSTFYLYGIF